MNYRINFHAAASAQVPGLSAEAWQALVDELIVIAADPQHRGLPDPDDARFRDQAFGRAGLVSYMIDETNQTVHIYAITWAD